MSTNNISYFIFSSTELKRLMEVSSKMGKKYTAKYVIVSGQKKEYTSIVSDLSKVRFTDAITLISGDINTIKYTR